MGVHKGGGVGIRKVFEGILSFTIQFFSNEQIVLFETFRIVLFDSKIFDHYSIFLAKLLHSRTVNFPPSRPPKSAKKRGGFSGTWRLKVQLQFMPSLVWGTQVRFSVVGICNALLHVCKPCLSAHGWFPTHL